jgi:hypothetical protein
MQVESKTPALSKGKLIAAAAALLIGGLLVVNGTSRNANAASAFDASFQAPQARMHDGVDWSRVAATPIDTGASIATYER